MMTLLSLSSNWTIIPEGRVQLNSVYELDDAGLSFSLLASMRQRIGLKKQVQTKTRPDPSVRK